MSKTGFVVNTDDGDNSDIGDLLVRRDIFSEGGLWAFGYNNNGQLGDNSQSHKSSPIQTITGGSNWKSISGGVYHTSAIKTDGTLWTWGYNAYGQLGNNSVSDMLSPVQTITGGSNWKLISCGYYHTSAIKTDGTLWTWGWNAFGQLGDDSTSNKSSPVQTIAGGSNWKSISCGYHHTSAIKTDGTLWTWGWNVYGQLGDDSTFNKSSPVQTIAGGSNWKSISSGSFHTLAIKTDGTLWTWGRNTYGQLGDNSITDKLSPVQTIAGGSNWKSISGGGYHTSAIKTDGTLWTWGRNVYGQLGDDSTTNKSSPVQTIAGGSNWKSISCGGYHTLAIKTDGTLWTWGRDAYGQLGDDSTSNKSSPVQTITGGSNWKSISGGGYHTSAIKDDIS